MSRLWSRTYAFDALVVAVALGGALEVVIRRDAANAPDSSVWFAAPAIALLALPLLARRRYPFAAPAGLWVVAAVLSFVDGELVTFTASASIAGLAAAFLLGNLRNATLTRVGLVLTLGSSALLIYNDPDHSAAQLVFTPLLFGIGWLAGFALRERAEEAEAAEARAAQAEREREGAARIAVAEERARIARELHDIVAHAVSVMVLQVGAVRHKLPAELAADKDALGDVERAGRGALGEMRRLLGAMRDENGDVALAPQPGLDGLDALAESVGRAGLPVELHVEGEAFPLPRAVELSAYRIVQEGLTNSLKHARAGRARVTIRYGAEELEVEVEDDGHGPAKRRRPRPRPRRRPRAREDLRRRDVGRAWRGRGLRPQRPAAGRGWTSVIRVLVADDQSLVRSGFRMLLDGESDMELVAEASNGLEAVDKAARFAPTVILMDIRMPELDGLEATRRILADDPAARVLVLTTFDLDEYVFEALRAGASGFILKDEPTEHLLEAIRVVAAGEALLSPVVTKRVIAQFTRLPHRTPPPELAELTEREREVFRLIAKGLSNAEIGEQLFITETTVKTHVTHLLQKLDLRDRVQAVVLAYETGIFEGDSP